MRPAKLCSTGASADLRQPREHFRGDAHAGPAASRRSRAACGISTASRDRSRHSERALSGCGACRRAGAGGSGRFGSVCSRGRYTRFRGNVSASGVRREQGGNAARARRSRGGSGDRTRTIPPALRRALHHRDRRCRFPGCTVRCGQGHHIVHWAQGGPTDQSARASSTPRARVRS